MIETCSTGEEGCLEWSAGEDCASHEPPQFCFVSDTGATCVDECVDRCTTIDARGCNLDAVSTCERNDSGCLDWVVEEDCTLLTPVHVCDENEGNPICVLACTDACTPAGATRCAGVFVERCTTNVETGCLAWATDTNCSSLDPPRTCSDATGTPTCVLGCTDACPAVDDLRCNDDLLEICRTGTSGCREWQLQTNCATLEPPQTCDDTGTPACVPLCIDACETADDLRCNEDLLEICRTGTSGCLEWQLQTNCALLEPPQTCDDTVTPMCIE
jgi:hypothetical protein